MANNDRKEILATIRDVAKAAGVSPATVSRYYSGSSVVGTELSNQIENAAEKLGYIHKYRKRKDRGVIALLLSDLELSFYGDVVKEILEQISRYRYRLIIIPYSNEENDYKHFKAISKAPHVQFKDKVQQLICDLINNNKTIREKIKKNTKISDEIVIKAFSASFETIISFWIDNDLSESPEKVVDNIIKIEQLFWK